MLYRDDREWCADNHEGRGSGVADLFGVWDYEEGEGNFAECLCGVFQAVLLQLRGMGHGQTAVCEDLMGIVYEANI